MKNFDPAIREAMRREGIDEELTLKILAAENQGSSAKAASPGVSGFPGIDGKTVLDMTRCEGFEVSAKDAGSRLAALLPGLRPKDFCRPSSSGAAFFPRKSLLTLGRLLYPYVSFGVLNGGSATSYCDTKKNSAFHEGLFRLLAGPFEESARLARGRPKGITPAYADPGGSPGYSFMELKLRCLLREALLWKKEAALYPNAYSHGGRPCAPGLLPLAPFFQMTSVFTAKDIAAALLSYRASPLLADLIAKTGIDITRAETGVQPLIAAFTPSAEGSPRRIFTRAGGKENSVLGLPGGHGQNFFVLADVYRRLRAAGKRFVYLGNIDNLGFTPDPASVAVLALSGRPAGFDFAFKTAVDTKGGVLVRDSRGRLTCVDIGPALPPDELAAAEASGKPVLFNAATGLFDLDYLVPHLGDIINGIHLRWSDQDKDAGRYAQAEQITWEVIGLLEDPLIFGVDKFRRFLAAKLLVESLMTSGLGLNLPEFPADLRPLAQALHAGFTENMQSGFGMRTEGGRWVPAKEL